jgi:hypothetical protein
VLTRAIRLKSSSCWEIVLEGVKVMDLGAGFIIGEINAVSLADTSKLLRDKRQSRYDSAVPSEEYESLLNELRAWCTPRGRKLELARALDVSPALVTLWLRGERLLSLEQWLSIKKIIRLRRRPSRKP